MKMRYRTRDLLREISRLTVYRLVQLVPKQKHIWVFGAWKGEKYSDNSKYLFEYVNTHCTEIRAVWMTNSKLAYELVSHKGYSVNYFGSLRSIWTCMRAGVAITCVDAARDLPSFALSEHTKRVQLWHGLGLKGYRFTKMGERDRREVAQMDFLSKMINKAVVLYAYALTRTWYNGIAWLPYYLVPRQDLVVTTSQLGKRKMQSVFGEIAPKIEILGYPRHDHLIQGSLRARSKIRPIPVFYAPTHRSESQDPVIADIPGLAAALARRSDILFITKLHDLAVIPEADLALLRVLDNFQLLDERDVAQDIYTVLPQMAVLMTDYSSIYTDYLLLDRPIIFTPFDLAAYSDHDQGLFLDYDQVTPGPKAKTWDEALTYAATYETWGPRYARARKKTLALFHEMRDGGSSARITERLLKLSDELPDVVPDRTG